MNRRVEILGKKDLLPDAFFGVEEVELRFETFAGQMSDAVVRLSLERGDGVAAVMHDVDNAALILVEQFRYSTYKHGDGWLIELPAGILNPGEDPADAMRREMLEETGYQVAELQPIHTFYLSPGGSSERIFLFYAVVKQAEQVREGGGLAVEHEDLRVISLPVAEVMSKLDAGFFLDAKTIIGLQWLQAHKLYPKP